VVAATRDRDDDYLVALGSEHGVDWSVTGDKDLLEWETQTGDHASRLRMDARQPRRLTEQGCRRANGLLMASGVFERHLAVGSGLGGRCRVLATAGRRWMP